MRDLFILIDYKGHFGSKCMEETYRSGFDLNLLKDSFIRCGYNVVYLSFSEVDLRKDWKDKIVLYTSSEDVNYLYKSYIEDVIYGLELSGALVIPKFKYLRCNNNKVFMEMTRDMIEGDSPLHSMCFGSLPELESAIQQGVILYPCVIKSAGGACSYGVRMANNSQELIRHAKVLAASHTLKTDIHETIRGFRHKGYILESRYRKKFIVQPMITGLANDWKILIFGNQYYTLIRHVRKNDFRASGSHNDYRLGSESEIPEQVIEHARIIYEKLDVPMLSIDMAFDGTRSYMIEFQTLYFGAWTYYWSNDYYEYNNGKWLLKEKEGKTYEDLYAWSISEFLTRKGLL